MKLERPVSRPAALNPKATLDREAEGNGKIIKRRGNWRGGKRGGEVELEVQGNETKLDKERKEDKFTPMGDGDDDEEIGKVTFQK